MCFCGGAEDRSDWAHVARKLGLPEILSAANKNPVEKKPYKEYYSKQSKDVIENKFRTGIEYFGYEFGS